MLASARGGAVTRVTKLASAVGGSHKRGQCKHKRTMLASIRQGQSSAAHHHDSKCQPKFEEEEAEAEEEDGMFSSSRTLR